MCSSVNIFSTDCAHSFQTFRQLVMFHTAQFDQLLDTLHEVCKQSDDFHKSAVWVVNKLVCHNPHICSSWMSALLSLNSLPHFITLSCDITSPHHKRKQFHGGCWWAFNFSNSVILNEGDNESHFTPDRLRNCQVHVKTWFWCNQSSYWPHLGFFPSLVPSFHAECQLWNGKFPSELHICYNLTSWKY